MTLILFEGPAGSGKTTRLVAAVREHLQAHPLLQDQRVLGLTRYHGSRRRMHDTLRAIPGIGSPVCQTVDSFAWHLVCRWHSLATYLGVAPSTQDYAATVNAAAVLLREPQVAAWIARSFPIVVLDEVQDCKAGWLALLVALTGHLSTYGAADAFQDLSGDTHCEALDWARGAGSVEVLSGNHRTRVSGLLAAAEALRNGQPVPTTGQGFSVQSVPKAAVAGGAMSWKIKGWQSSGPIAVITATKPDNSPFAKQVVDWVSTKKAKNGRNEQTSGPFPVIWESQDEDTADQLAKGLGVRDEPNIGCVDLAARLQAAGEADLVDWVRHQRFVLGRETVECKLVEDAIKDSVRRRRAFGGADNWRRRAMTVHQAKNREFESVIVLWPLRMKSGAESQRRLLYNAITRAKKQALVLVEDPKKDRLKKPPFV